MLALADLTRHRRLRRKHRKHRASANSTGIDGPSVYVRLCAVSLTPHRRAAQPFLERPLVSRVFRTKAGRRSDEALQLARESHNPSAFRYRADFRRGLFYPLVSDEDRLSECIEIFPAVAAEIEAGPGPARLIQIRKGWLLVIKGELQEGIKTICDGIAGSATGARYHDSFHRALLSLAYLHANQFDDGLDSLDDALRLVPQSRERYYEAELYRLRGELLLTRGRVSDEAEIADCFQKAIDVARLQNAKSWELRATTSLARLLEKQCRRDEARTMLAEIYGWFTEGFDTADLKDAKALLDELSARIIGSVRCSNCNTENPDGLQFCNECGTAFKKPCASCGFENAPAAKSVADADSHWSALLKLFQSRRRRQN